MAKNTPFSQFCIFCTPKRCTHVRRLVLKNGPNLSDFVTMIISTFTNKCPPGQPLNIINLIVPADIFICFHMQQTTFFVLLLQTIVMNEGESQ